MQPRHRKLHVLKVAHTFYDDVETGIKPFEFRLDDRAYEVGDFLLLKEIHVEGVADVAVPFVADPLYTGRCCVKEITYILTHKMFKPCPEGYVVMGLKPATYQPQD